MLNQVVAWLHNDKGQAHTSEFWQLAADRIAGDLDDVDTTAAGWDDTSSAAVPSVWFYALLREARIWAEDSEGASIAEDAYQRALALANSGQRRGTPEQLSRPYQIAEPDID